MYNCITVTIIYSTMHEIMSTTEYNILYNVHCTSYSIRRTLHDVHYTLYNIQCDIYNNHCIRHTQWTIYFNSYVLQIKLFHTELLIPLESRHDAEQKHLQVSDYRSKYIFHIRCLCKLYSIS